jgi:hypothetical protein
MTGGLYALEVVFFTIFGSGEEQPWNKIRNSGDEYNAESVPLNDSSKATSPH